mgnify:CR=1 FL=1
MRGTDSGSPWMRKHERRRVHRAGGHDVRRDGGGREALPGTLSQPRRRNLTGHPAVASGDGPMRAAVCGSAGRGPKARRRPGARSDSGIRTTPATSSANSGRSSPTAHAAGGPKAPGLVTRSSPPHVAALTSRRRGRNSNAFTAVLLSHLPCRRSSNSRRRAACSSLSPPAQPKGEPVPRRDDLRHRRPHHLGPVDHPATARPADQTSPKAAAPNPRNAVRQFVDSNPLKKSQYAQSDRERARRRSPDLAETTDRRPTSTCSSSETAAPTAATSCIASGGA